MGPPLTGDSYQRDLLKPPPPFATRPPPSPFGRVSLTLSVFPSRSLPLRASIAFWASASLLISTNPKPLGWPVSRSVTILTCPTVPCVSKSERTDCSSGPKTEVPYKDVLHLFLPSGFDGRLIGAGGTKTIGGRSNTANSIAQCCNAARVRKTASVEASNADNGGRLELTEGAQPPLYQPDLNLREAQIGKSKLCSARRGSSQTRGTSNSPEIRGTRRCPEWFRVLSDARRRFRTL